MILAVLCWKAARGLLTNGEKLSLRYGSVETPGTTYFEVRTGSIHRQFCYLVHPTVEEILHQLIGGEHPIIH